MVSDANPQRIWYIEPIRVVHWLCTILHFNSRVLLLTIVLLGPVHAWAGAVLFIYPTLIIFEGRERSATVTLTNRGDATGTFETSWSELEMTPEGGLLKVDGDTPWSVQPYVRYSPRRVTLEPSQSQVIKIALRRDQEAPEGEYFSHFRVLTLNSQDLGGETEAEVEPSETDAVIKITARSAVAIPIIWRNSQASPGATIKSVEIDPETNQLTVDVRRNGKLSVRGYLHVLGKTSDGEDAALADPVPLIIYPSIDQRITAITLNDDVSAGALSEDTKVIYATTLNSVTQDTTLATYPVVP
jgi:P pilus assembly chaperone PapD